MPGDQKEPKRFDVGDDTTTPHPLKGKGEAVRDNERLFWSDLLVGDMTGDCLQIRHDLNDERPMALVYRSCYSHLLSRVIYCWNHQHRQCLLTGTPGTGKTIFGWFLIRHLFREELGKGIVYAFKKKLYLITNDEEIREELGTKATVTVFHRLESELHDNALLRDKRLVAIQDPARDAAEPASIRAENGPCRVFLLSYGHWYLNYWKSKDLGPVLSAWFYNPLWSVDEGKKHESTLKMSNSLLNIEESWKHFGGSLRKWLQARNEKDFKDVKEQLIQHIRTMVKTHPRGDIQGHTDESDWRGMLVQIDVPFDDYAPLWPSSNLLPVVSAPTGGAVSESYCCCPT